MYKDEGFTYIKYTAKLVILVVDITISYFISIKTSSTVSLTQDLCIHYQLP